MQANTQSAGDQDAFKRVGRLALWTLAWVGTLALARFGPSHLWDSQPVASWSAIVTNLLAGTGWIAAHARYLQGLDELQRKIMVDAMAITLGVGWVGGFAYIVAEAADLVTLDSELGLLSALLGVVYMVATAAGNLRYR